MIAADLTAFMSLAMLSLCEKNNCAGFPLYFGVTFLTHLCGTVVMIGTQSIMGGFGDEKKVAKAQATFETMRRVFMVASPILAGLILEWFGRWQIFAIDSLTYLISLWGTAVFLWDEEIKRVIKKSGLINYLLPKIDWSKKIIQIVASVILINLIYAPLMLLWPVFAKTFNGGASFMGLLSGAFTFGSIIGGIWIIKSKNIQLHKQTLSSMLTIALGFLLFFIGKLGELYLLAIPAFFIGFGFGSMSGPIMSIIHSHIPDESKGSFFGWLGFVGQIGQPLIVLIAGFISEKLGVWYLVFFMSILSFGVSLIFNSSANSAKGKEVVL